MKGELIIEDNSVNNIEAISVKRFNSPKTNLNSPNTKDNQVLVIEKTDRSSEINEKCLPTISKINLMQTNLPKALRKLKLFNIPQNNNDANFNEKENQSSQRKYIMNLIKNNLIKFLTTPLERTIWLKGKIVSSRERNIHILRYYLIDDINSPERLVMIAKKTKKNRYELFANYNETNKTVLIGKLSANVFGNSFKLKSNVSNQVIERIKYEFNLFGLNGPLKLTVNTLLNGWEMGDEQVFSTKCPSYSIKFNCYVLNYIDRSIKSSIKNFQLISFRENDNNNNDSSTRDDENDDEIILQFGEISSCSFALDFKTPFSPFQSFGIGISCIRNKILCE